MGQSLREWNTALPRWISAVQPGIFNQKNLNKLLEIANYFPLVFVFISMLFSSIYMTKCSMSYKQNKNQLSILRHLHKKLE
jgi:hypothetical protein